MNPFSGNLEGRWDIRQEKSANVVMASGKGQEEV